MKKVWYYIDESGYPEQPGFIVCITRVLTEVDTARIDADTIRQTTKKKLKWSDSKDAIRAAYMPLLLALAHFETACVVFEQGGDRWARVSEALIAVLITQPANEQAILTIDALPKNNRDEVIVPVRQAGIKIHDIKSRTEQNETLLHIPDAMAGLFKDGSEDRYPFAKLLKNALDKKKLRRIDKK